MVTVTDAPELSTKVGIFASVTSGAIASDVGVIPIPISPTFWVDDHLLDDAAGIVGDASIITHEEFDLPPGDVCAVLLNIKLERARELPADGVEARPRQGNAHAHFQNIVGGCGSGAQTDGGACRQSLEQGSAQHLVPPRFLFS